jgi:hypothetical protein
MMTPLGSPGSRLELWEQVGETLDHVVTGVTWRRPRAVEVRGDRLTWTPVAAVGERVRPGPGLLERFVALDRAPAVAIERYARQWGPLWLCEHGLPWEHDPGTCRAQRDEESGWFSESLAHWRTLARGARATVRIARRLHAGAPGDRADWEQLPGLSRSAERALLDAILAPEQYGIDGDDEQREWPPGRDDVLYWERRRRAAVVKDWLWLGSVEPILEWEGSRPQLHLGGRGLLGGLAVQILFDTSRTDGLAVCVSCGTPFLPASRRPRWDRNAYCSDCGLRAATRDAAARYRRTEKYRLASQARQSRTRA